MKEKKVNLMRFLADEWKSFGVGVLKPPESIVISIDVTATLLFWHRGSKTV